MKGMRVMAMLMALILLLLSLFSCATPNRETSIQPKVLTWAIGTELPTAEAFFDALPDGDRVSFAKKNPFEVIQMGKNEIEIRYQPAKGRAKTVTAILNLIVDTEPPVISGAKDIIAYVGEGVSYRSGVTVTDNCAGEITLTVDSLAVDTANEGVYPVISWATDAAGNVSTAQASVHVYREEITEAMLYALVDPLIAELGLSFMGKEEQVRAIYRFVHTDARITYVDTSDKTSWIRAAYFCLQSRKGDCFSYFAVSKAFFERLGIENMDIQRTPGFTADTHYWSLVNIGDATGARWYHYDATRLRDVYYEGSLLTDRQVDAFCRVREYFYLYDRTGYPATDTREITSRPDLERYY